LVREYQGARVHPVPEPDIPFLTNAGIHTDREDHEANHGNNYLIEGNDSLAKFVGFWSTLIQAGFSYQGTELVGTRGHDNSEEEDRQDEEEDDTEKGFADGRWDGLAREGNDSLAKFVGFWSTLIQAGFSYQGTELVGIAAGAGRRTRPE
jgi:amino acid permease